MGLIGKCCCLSLLLTKLLCLVLTFGPLILMYLLYAFYIKPWGEQQIKDLTHGVDLSSPSVNCSGCVIGVNTQFPTNTTGILHFMDTSAGTVSSAAVGASLISTIAAIIAGTAVGGSVIQFGSSGSMGAGLYEMMAIVEQAQFVGLLGQLATTGAPTFFQQFTKDLSWVNFNIAKLSNSDPAPTRKLLSLLEAQHEQTGVERYATMVGVLPEELFYYTLLALGVLFGAVFALYIVAVLIMSCFSKDKSNLWAVYFRKVIWACVLLLLLSLYIVSMTGSYRAYFTFHQGATSAGSAAVVILLALVGATLIFGIVVIASNPAELKDIGTYEHEQRPFNAKYGPYYEEFNIDNRYFFVPKAILAVSTGIMVGVIQNPTWQLGLLVAANLLFLGALVVREPFLLRFLFYIGVVSSFLKVFLLLLMIIMLRDDVFPQKVRDNVAYVIVGVNLAVFALLVIRQLYVTGRKVVMSCSAKKSDSSQRADFNEAHSPIQTPDIQQPKSHFSDVERGNLHSSNNTREPLNPRSNPRSEGIPPTQFPQQPKEQFASMGSYSQRNQGNPTESLDRPSSNALASSSVPATQRNQKVNSYEGTKALSSQTPTEFPIAPVHSNSKNSQRVSDFHAKSPPQYGMDPSLATPSKQATSKYDAGASVAGATSLVAAAAYKKDHPAQRQYDPNEYDIDSELPIVSHGKKSKLPQDYESVTPTRNTFQQASFDSYGSGEQHSFGSYQSGSLRQNSVLSDISGDSHHAPPSFSSRESSTGSLRFDSSTNSFLNPSDTIPQPTNVDISSEYAPESTACDSYTSGAVPNRPIDYSFQSANFDDLSFCVPSNNGSFNSSGYSEGPSQSGVLDTLAAKYLTEMDSMDDNTIPRLVSVPILELKSSTVPVRQRSQSMDDLEFQAPDDHMNHTLQNRHSDSQLLDKNGDEAKRQAVYLRYIADGQVHSFIDSDDEIDL